MDRLSFPNATQIPSRLPLRWWRLIRGASIVVALAVAALLIFIPDTGLVVMWKVVIPLLPLLFLLAPGLWRNICPLAASNQTPRALGITRAKTAPAWLKEYGYVIAFSLFIGFVVLRKARPRRQRAAERAAAARRDDRRASPAGCCSRARAAGARRSARCCRCSASTARRRC